MISQYMTHDHRKCDLHFGEIEDLVRAKNFSAAKELFSQWATTNLAHFDAEEKILFPELEKAIGQQIPPVFVMLSEHMQIKSLIQQMENALIKEDKDNFLGNADTCMIMIQQHNMKEEQILYPMIDRALSSNREQIFSEVKTKLES